ALWFFLPIGAQTLMADGVDVAVTTSSGNLRYWQKPFESLAIGGCYVSLTRSGNMLELWGSSGSVVLRGERLGELTHVEPTGITDDLINDVFDLSEPTGLSTDRKSQRFSTSLFAGVGYVTLVGVTIGYSPGSVPMNPALLVSKDGREGTWKYLGKLKGEPDDELLRGRKMIWSDCGSIVRLSGGTWRIYLTGFGPPGRTLVALESDTLEGPWRFFRSSDGSILDLLAGQYPHKGSCFPNLVMVSDEEWHVWISNQWPPSEIWHFYSKNGKDFRRYGEQPEILRENIKCLRVFYDPKEKILHGLLSVWEEKEDWWILHHSTMNSGLGNLTLKD
ncbi:MAG: hypothetical protein HQL31_13920, partial [Planctomycetes bacterium]|nr:hypothetical protein [Planctomycetota bacterium]